MADVKTIIGSPVFDPYSKIWQFDHIRNGRTFLFHNFYSFRINRMVPPRRGPPTVGRRTWTVGRGREKGEGRREKGEGRREKGEWTIDN